MKELVSYIEKNGNFSKYKKFYDEEECIFYWEAFGNVVFSDKYFDVSIFTKIQPSQNEQNTISSKKLIDKLVNKIIFEMGLKFTKEYFNETKNIKILNCGNKKDLTENSLEALYDACKKYDGFKTYVRLTKDNYWVVYHDDSCNRLHGFNIKIKDYTLSFLKKNVNIITLKDLLFTNKFKNKFINIEIKEDFNTSILNKLNLINLLTKFKNRILVSSFKWGWYKLMKGYHFDFAHMVSSLDKLPLNSKKIILSKKDYQQILLKNFNLNIFGIYDTDKKINSVSLSIIDL